MRQVPRLAGTVVMLALMFPPWRIVWAPASGGSGPVATQRTWAGFHFYAYGMSSFTKDVAWDGPGTGGHVQLEGFPEIAYGPWGGILLFAAGVVYLSMRLPGREKEGE